MKSIFGILRKSPGASEACSRSGSALVDVNPHSQQSEGICPTKDNPLGGELFFGVLIGINAVLIGIETDMSIRKVDDPTTITILYILQCLFAFVFLLELIMRICVCGWRTILLSWGGVLDAFVVSVSIVDLWIITPMTYEQNSSPGKNSNTINVFRMIHLFRVMRIMRLVHISPELSLLLLGLATSLKAVVWVFMLLFLVMYCGAIFCALELGNSKNPKLREAFGTIPYSLYTHFKLLTLESWPDILGWAMEQSNWWVMYFLTYIMITNLALVNLITGVILDGVMKYAKSEDMSNEMHFAEAEPFVESVITIMESKDVDKDGTLGKAEFKHLMQDEDFKHLLLIYGISLRADADDLFDVLDDQGAGCLSFDELTAALLRLRGSNDKLHTLLLRSDIYRQSRGLLQEIHQFRGSVNDKCMEAAQQFNRSVSEKLGATISKFVGKQRAKVEEQHVLNSQISTLLVQASTKVKNLNEAISKVEAKLHQKMSYEDSLHARLAAKRHISSQTETGIAHSRRIQNPQQLHVKDDTD